MTPKSKSFLWLHRLELHISLSIAGAAAAGMPRTTLQGEHLSLKGARGHCQFGGYTYTGFAVWGRVPAAVRSLGRDHRSFEKRPQLQPS